MSDEKPIVQSSDQSQPETAVTPQMAPQPPSQPKKSKKLFWGILGGSIGLLFIVLGVVLAVVLLNRPDAKDFRLAQQHAESMADAFNKIDYHMRGESNVENIAAGLKEYKTALGTLDGGKFREDPVIDSAYKGVKHEGESLIEFVDSTLLYYSAVDQCNSATAKFPDMNLSMVYQEYNELMKPCLESFEKLKDAPTRLHADYAKKLLALYEEQKGLVKEWQKAIDSGSEFNQAVRRQNVEVFDKTLEQAGERFVFDFGNQGDARVTRDRLDVFLNRLSKRTGVPVKNKNQEGKMPIVEDLDPVR